VGRIGSRERRELMKARKQTRRTLLVVAGFLAYLAVAKSSMAGLCTASCWSDDWTGRVCCTTEDCFDYCL
jgi:hypothetical protein